MQFILKRSCRAQKFQCKQNIENIEDITGIHIWYNAKILINNKWFVSRRRMLPKIDIFKANCWVRCIILYVDGRKENRFYLTKYSTHFTNVILPLGINYVTSCTNVHERKGNLSRT